MIELLDDSIKEFNEAFKMLIESIGKETGLEKLIKWLSKKL